MKAFAIYDIDLRGFRRFFKFLSAELVSSKLAKQRLQTDDFNSKVGDDERFC